MVGAALVPLLIEKDPNWDLAFVARARRWDGMVNALSEVGRSKAAKAAAFCFMV